MDSRTLGPIARVAQTCKPMRLCGWAVAGMVIGLLAMPAAAQQTPAVTPPQLKQFVEAEYPTGKETEAAVVVLALSISETGQVTNVEVVESASPEFDQAAVRAARQFVFEPAKVDGTPRAVRIQYRYVFEPQETEIVEEEVEVPAPPPEPAVQESLKTRVQSFSATARVEQPPREVTRRTITSEFLVRAPGTRGDPLRAVELLPGVGRPPFSTGALIVRGSAPQDSQAQLENLPIPLLYHFGGLTSVIHPRLIDRIDFYPGNFAARFGRRVGGILDVGLRDPRQDSIHGLADINVIDASALLEAPIGDKASVAVAGRRSYVDLWLQEVLPQDDVSIVAAPVYWDYQLVFNYKPTARDDLRLLAYGSSDRLRLLAANPADGDPVFRGNFSLQNSFHRVHGSWRHRYSNRLQQRLDIAVGTLNLNAQLGPELEFEVSSVELLGRAEWNYRLARRVRLIGGLDMRVQPAEFRFVGPQPTQGEGNPGEGIGGQDPVSTQELVSGTGSIVIYQPAVYLTTDIQPIDDLQVLLGLRLDWFDAIRSWAFNPRAVFRYALTERTTVKAGVGIFSQPPEIQESAEQFGNTNLKPIQSVHLSTGVEHNFSDIYFVGAEVFYKYLWDRVVGTQGALPPYFINDGVGRIYGVELAAKIEPKSPVYGFLSYTLSRSERRDRSEPWRLFDFDQTHILTISGIHRLGNGWEWGATFRLVTGNPITPVVAGVYNANADIYQPIYGAINSERNPAFHRLDVRVEKQWKFQDWMLAAYLDVQNIYNRMNPEGIVYNYNFTDSAQIRGLPIIPSLGLRGEF